MSISISVLSPSQTLTLEDDSLPVKYLTKTDLLMETLSGACDAAVLRRSIPDQVARSIEGIPADLLPHGRFILPPELVSHCLRELFRRSGTPSSAATEWLCEDAGRLAQSVRQILNVDSLRLRLEVVEDNACSKLHVDNVIARVICTYRGPGTQIGLPGAPSDTLSTVPTGSPIFLKGKRWPGQLEPRLHHRSPPIKGTKLVRLVLVLEGASAADALPGYDVLYRGTEGTSHAE